MVSLARPFRGRAYLLPELTSMYSKDDQLRIITDIIIGEGQSITTDCPFCGGRNKFTISKQDGTTLWNCYRASCTARGAVRSGFKAGELRNKIAGVKTELARRVRPIPEVTSAPANHPSVMEYLERNNCIDALSARLINIRYHPADNRVLFFTNNDSGAIGRHLGSGIPKWMSYGDTSGILAVGKSPDAVLVEDAASACAVAATGVYTGIALLGTNISPVQRRQLVAYRSLIIALDKDANKTALRHLGRMRSLIQSRIVFLPNDLKNYGPRRILEILKK